MTVRENATEHALLLHAYSLKEKRMQEQGFLPMNLQQEEQAAAAEVEAKKTAHHCKNVKRSTSLVCCVGCKI